MFMISPEYDTLQVKRVFDDARGWDSNSQHILLGGKVGCLSNPVQRIQITVKEEKENNPGFLFVITTCASFSHFSNFSH